MARRRGSLHADSGDERPRTDEVIARHARASESRERAAKGGDGEGRRRKLRSREDMRAQADARERLLSRGSSHASSSSSVEVSYLKTSSEARHRVFHLSRKFSYHAAQKAELPRFAGPCNM